MPPTWPDRVPILVDPASGVLLRAHRSDDIPRIVEQCNDPGSIRWTTVPQPYTAADAKSWITEIIPAGWEAGTMSHWAIEAEIGGERRYCGTFDLRHPDGVRGEVGYGLHPDARGRGILTAAGRLAIDHGFDSLGLGVIRWAAYVGNWASRRTAAALGFREEGIRRAHMQHRGELVDCWSAAILPTDPRVSVAAPRLPALQGERVRLRPFRDDDAARVGEAHRDPESALRLPGVPQPFTTADERGFIDWCRDGEHTGTRWTWAVTDDTDVMLGAITLFHDREPHEVGYWLHPDARGRGAMTEALDLVSAYALGEGGQPSLVVRCAADNTASRAVARRAGFTETGVLPKAERQRDGAYADLVVHARTVGGIS
ncbi:hypothetical protein GCM10027418_02190 [Mariniluteicoccus endophyticus]